MGSTASPHARRYVGRRVERDALREALTQAASGQPCAVVIEGEAGIGKTELVRATLDELPDFQVLWGSCVHFGVSSLPFAPVVGALRAWQERGPAGHEEDLTGGIVDNALRHLTGSAVGNDGALPVIDSVVNRLATRGPTAVVIDDLHWADASTLDFLAFLIVGMRGQRLAVLSTVREEERPEGHPLHAWLADMRRMPPFSQLQLGRLDVAGTELLLGELLERPVDVSLAAEVHDRADGNPYLTELVAHDLRAGASLVGRTPSRLRDALVAAWHALSRSARDITRLVAVGGRPMPFWVLSAVASRHGHREKSLSKALVEAEQGGVIRREGDRVWFRHPLLAEVLYDLLSPGEAAPLHAIYADVLSSAPGLPAERLAADLAVHHERAGHSDAAFVWSLRAADFAASLRASVEEATHLERACALWHLVSERTRAAGPGRMDLMVRAGKVGLLAGRHEDAQRIIENALSLVDRDSEPLLASRLLCSWAQLRWEIEGPGTSVFPENHEAVRLTDRFPDSPERAIALAALAGAEGWDGDLSQGLADAEEAVAVATRSGSELALAEALSTRAALSLANPGPEVHADLERAERLAWRAGDVDIMVEVAIWRANLLAEEGRLDEAVVVARRAFEEGLRAGIRHWPYFLAGLAAADQLCLGRFDEAGDLLRTALAARCRGIPGALVRLSATQLEVRRGQPAAARQHLLRAFELVDRDFAGLRGALLGTEAEVHLAYGDPGAALAGLRVRLYRDGALDRRADDGVLVWVARAAADLARRARDRGDALELDRILADLDLWMSDFGRVRSAPARRTASGDACSALIRAELARARHTEEELDLWEQALKSCAEAQDHWDQALCRWRWIQAAVRSGLPRSAVAEQVRVLHGEASAMGARPLTGQAEFLARTLRVDLERPAVAGATHRVPAQREPATDRLTNREREVLAHLVVGRTNAEIAKQLVISEKTVSVHVSNILRKTGTTNRVEAAAFAARLAEA